MFLAAQKLILGPNFWFVSYDSLLSLGMPNETCLVGYDKDVTALISGASVELAHLKLSLAMQIVNGWMRDYDLSLPLSKTLIMVLTNKLILTIISLQVGDQETDQTCFEISGVMISSNELR